MGSGEGGSVLRTWGGGVVVCEARAGLGPRGRLAATDYQRRLIVVYLRKVERLLGTDLANPRVRIALGRIIAHELEHVRRQTAEPDSEAFFRPYSSPHYLLRLTAP